MGESGRTEGKESRKESFVVVFGFFCVCAATADEDVPDEQAASEKKKKEEKRGLHRWRWCLTAGARR